MSGTLSGATLRVVTWFEDPALRAAQLARGTNGQGQFLIKILWSVIGLEASGLTHGSAHIKIGTSVTHNIPTLSLQEDSDVPKNVCKTACLISRYLRLYIPTVLE